MAGVVQKTLIVSAAEVTATGWIKLNTDQENFNVGFAIRKSDSGDTPVLNVEGTMQDVLTSANVVSGYYFPLISAVSTSAQGTIVAGQITFPVEALRLRTISGGSGNSTLHFSVLQAGKV